MSRGLVQGRVHVERSMAKKVTQQQSCTGIYVIQVDVRSETPSAREDTCRETILITTDKTTRIYSETSQASNDHQTCNFLCESFFPPSLIVKSSTELLALRYIVSDINTSLTGR